MFRTRFCLLQWVLLSTMVCLAAAPAFGKGKPKADSEPSTPPPVNYDITWLRADGVYDRTYLHDVDGTGSTAVGRVVISGTSHAISMDIFTGTVSHLIDDVASLMPLEWQESQLMTAQEINNSGRIAGQLMDNRGATHLYVYDPSDSFKVIRGGSTVLDMNEAGDVIVCKVPVQRRTILRHPHPQPADARIAGKPGYHTFQQYLPRERRRPACD